MLPTLPKADDFFLLRWLRGEIIGVRETESKEKERTEQENEVGHLRTTSLWHRLPVGLF